MNDKLVERIKSLKIYKGIIPVDLLTTEFYPETRTNSNNEVRREAVKYEIYNQTSKFPYKSHRPISKMVTI